MLSDRIVTEGQHSPEERMAYAQWKATGHVPKGFHFVYGHLVKMGGGFKPPQTKPKFGPKSDPDLPLFTSAPTPKKEKPPAAPEAHEAPHEPKTEPPLWSKWHDMPFTKEKEHKPERTPEERKIHQLAKTLRGQPLERVAAGGLVFKSFSAPSVEDLQVLVAKTHPKWGSYWVIPKGGADPGEHVHDTAARETEEETGVKAKVIPDHEPYVRSSTFGESGKYDLPLVTQALKDAHPDEADFIEQHKEKLKHEHFTIKNNSHYFLMQHVSGDPITHPDQSHDEEMSEARYMPIREALKIPKVGEVVEKMLPAIEKQWKAAGGKAKTESSLFHRIVETWSDAARKASAAVRKAHAGAIAKEHGGRVDESGPHTSVTGHKSKPAAITKSLEKRGFRREFYAGPGTTQLSTMLHKDGTRAHVSPESGYTTLTTHGEPEAPDEPDWAPTSDDD